jgi:hypothetical protein
MRHFSLLLGVALVGVVGCSNGVGITNPRDVAANLTGEWEETAGGPGRAFNRFSLTVSDTVVQGTGSWFDFVGGFGHSVISGVVSGSRIVLRIAQDNGTTFEYDAEMLSHNRLSGEIIDGSARVAADFDRDDGHVQPE